MAFNSTFVSGLRKTHRSAHTPTDLSHVILSTSAIAPRDLSPSLVSHLVFSRLLTLLSPQCSSRTLKLLRCRHHQKSARLPVQPTSKPSPIAVPFLGPINVALGHSRSSLNRGPFSLTLSYALFFRFLSSVLLPYSTIRHPLISRFTDDITARLRRPMHSYPRSAYLPACHLKNHTIRLSDTRLNLRSFACI